MPINSMAAAASTMLVMKEIPWTRKHFLSLNFKALEYVGYKLDKFPWTWSQKIRSYVLNAGMTLIVSLVAYNFYDIYANLSKGHVIKGVQSIALPSISVTAMISQLHFNIYYKELDSLFIQIDEILKLSLKLSTNIPARFLDKYSFVSNFLLIFLYTTIPVGALSVVLQMPVFYLLTHGSRTNYSEIPMSFELYYGTTPRESPTMFWSIAFLQTFQMILSLTFFCSILSCYLSILFFLICMNEITNIYFKYFFISHEDKENDRNKELIPFRGVLILHQKLLKAMELYSDIVSTLIFIAFALGVLFLAVSFFEIIMFGFDPQNSKAAFMILMAIIVTFCVMWFFQSVSDLSANPRQILYFRPWYRIKNQEFLFNVLFAMKRSTCGVKYTLGGLSTPASMNTFVSLLKCAFSYSSLLMETKNKIDH